MQVLLLVVHTLTLGFVVVAASPPLKYAHTETVISSDAVFPTSDVSLVSECKAFE